MRFHISVIEPKSYRFGHFLDDGIRHLLYGLEELGHDCTLGLGNVQSDRINIIWGGHCLTQIEDVRNIQSAGAYIAIHTEVLTSQGLNSWDNQSTVEQVYMPFLEGALAIWDGKLASLERLQALGLPAYMWRVGYHRRFEEIVHKREKDIDFSFFGSVTPHRAAQLDRLRQFGCEVATMFDARKIFRDDLIARTKVNLAPLQSLELDHLAIQRVGYLLCNRALCVVERAGDQQFFEHCFPWADTEHWAELCIETLHRPDRQQLIEACYERYREIRLEDGMQQTLDETFGCSSAPVIPRTIARAS